MDTTRFAPSPTGLLHLGHVAAARFARQRGTRFLLRLEDIDPVRCRPAFSAGIMADLLWLGLSWHGAVRVQSRHMADYARPLAALRGAGLLYPCFCTRADIAAAGAAPHRAPDGTAAYPGTCRRLAPAERAARLAEGRQHAWRLDVAASVQRAGPLSFHEQGEGRVPADPAPFGDVVLARKDTPASYHLCVAHDDAASGVTLVTRGADLRPATAVHRLLQHLLGWPEPGYAHHALVTGTDGARLSKRAGAPTVRALRESGLSPAAVLALA